MKYVNTIHMYMHLFNFLELVELHHLESKLLLLLMQ